MTTSKKWKMKKRKTTLKKIKMEDDLKKNGRQPKNKIKIEDDLN